MNKGVVPPVPEDFIGVYHDDKLVYEQTRKLDWYFCVVTAKDQQGFEKNLAEHAKRASISYGAAAAELDSSEDSSAALPPSKVHPRSNNNRAKMETIASRKRLVDFEQQREDVGLTHKQMIALMRVYIKEHKSK